MAQREKYIVGLVVPQHVKFEDINDRAKFIAALAALRDENKLTPAISIQEFGLDVTEELWPGTKKKIVILQDELSNITG
jgi:hypothetical protein